MPNYLRRTQRRRHAATAWGVVRRVLWAAVGSGALVGLATLGMMVTTAGPVLNFLVEPFSLFLIPGVAVGILWTALQGHLQHHVQKIADNHDFSAGFVVWCTFLLYFVAFCAWQFRLRRKPFKTSAARSR